MPPKFNLNYRFGADLKEIPEDTVSMQAYVDFLSSEVRLLPSPVPRDRARAAVKFLGEIGAYAKILRKPEVAVQALEQSLALIDIHGLGPGIWAIHTLRYGDALRFKRDDLAAEAAFRSVLELGSRVREVADLEHFAWQHLGKLRFDQKLAAEAEECLQKALAIRRRLGVPELIASTELALRVVKTKKPPR